LTPDTNRNGCSERETVAFHFKVSIEPRSRVESYIGLGTPAVFVINMESESPLADVPALRLFLRFWLLLKQQSQSLIEGNDRQIDVHYAKATDLPVANS
jgi:hypothetical protein